MFTRTCIAIALKSFCASLEGVTGKERNEQIGGHRK